MKKRIFCFLLAAAMVIGTIGCGSKKSTADESNSDSSDVPAYVTEPITIDLWHTFGSGVLGQYMEDVVARFNETNEYGITVNATYIGNYAQVLSDLTTSIGAKDNPQVAVISINDFVAETGILADLSAYAARDNVTFDDYTTGLTDTMYYNDQLVTLPFIRSATMFYYNIEQFAAVGYDSAPTSIEELEEACSAIAKKYNNYGFQLPIDMTFYQDALLRSLGGEGLIDDDGEGASCLDDGTFLKMMTDWRQWVDDGWCAVPNTTDDMAQMYQMMYSGQLASCVASSAVLNQMVTYGAEQGQTIGVAAMPTYSGIGGCGGGGNIAVIESNNNQQQIAASWEFVKFLMSDEEVANRSKTTGYLPTSEGAAALMEDVFEENPNLKIAFEARKTVKDFVISSKAAEWSTQTATAVSYVIQDRGMSAEESIPYLKNILPSVFN